MITPKHTIIAGAMVFIIGTAGIILSKSRPELPFSDQEVKRNAMQSNVGEVAENVNPQPSIFQKKEDSKKHIEEEDKEEDDDKDEELNTKISNVTSPAPPPASLPPPGITSFTTSQVALHANRESCWSIINGHVYDLTNWISQHPGGESEILKICGQYGGAAFHRQHQYDSEPANILATMKIGELAQ